MDNEDKLNYILKKLEKLPELRNQYIRFNEKYKIPLWDRNCWIEYEVKGDKGKLINWGESLPDKTKFSLKIFTNDNQVPYRIENHKEQHQGSDFVPHRNIESISGKEWIEHDKYSYPPYYSTLASFLGGFPTEREKIKKEIRTHFNW